VSLVNITPLPAEPPALPVVLTLDADEAQALLVLTREVLAAKRESLALARAWSAVCFPLLEREEAMLAALVAKLEDAGAR
jgi:hypothetical protein